MSGQIGEQGAGDGVAGFGVVEREDEDGAAVRSGDVANGDEGRGGAAEAGLMARTMGEGYFEASTWSGTHGCMIDGN